MEKEAYPCPACGFLVFSEPPGSYEICSICGWEDDHVQLAHPTMQGGANASSLLDYQTNILHQLPVEIHVFKEYKREIDWRPLTEKDYANDLKYPQTGLEYFYTAAEDAPTYYWCK